jgi:hypothetical protein
MIFHYKYTSYLLCCQDLSNEAKTKHSMSLSSVMAVMFQLTVIGKTLTVNGCKLMELEIKNGTSKPFK